MKDAASGKKTLILLTGMSGSGRSCFLKALEDMGYETIDNLPLALLMDTVALGGGERPLAIGVDIRTRGFQVNDLLDKAKALQQMGDLSTTLVFLDCDVEVLQRRYRETRRHHPLSVYENTLLEVILREQALLNPVKEEADLVIDTSLLSPPALKVYLQKQFGVSPTKTFQVTFMSFAFPKGVPREADFVFDMRFLSNPHYLETLKPLTGKDPSIQAYLGNEPDFQAFQRHLQGLFSLILPQLKAEGRDYVTIAFGCTGGKHRSVCAAELLSNWALQAGYTPHIHHRELDKGDF